MMWLLAHKFWFAFVIGFVLGHCAYRIVRGALTS